MKIDVRKTLPLQEYPRMQFKRDSYLNLNGKWQYAFKKSEAFLEKMDGYILVPYSPESSRSFVNRQLKKDEFLHYRKYFVLPQGFNKGRIILNIGAIDQRSKIYINKQLAFQSSFGYLPISVDITPYLKLDGDNEIYIIVYDDADSEIYARGKQRYKRGGIWYTAISGIYQSVWLESVPVSYLKNIKITPNYDKKSVTFEFTTFNNLTDINIKIYEEEKLKGNIVSKSGEALTFNFNSFIPWTVDNPFLYKLIITYKNDSITSYFAMRKFSYQDFQGYKLFTLNNEPILMQGVLDQGYYYPGIYTPKKVEDYIRDIKLAKDLGFNMLRMHARIESDLFYYYCDKLGMIVWQDMVNGGAKYKKRYIYLAPFINFNINDTTSLSLGRNSEKSRLQFQLEMQNTVKHLYNHPCISTWTLFNEGWGQFCANDNTSLLRKYYPTRLIDSTSGWFDQNCGDCNSKHIYFKTISLKNDHKRVLVLSEFGGYSLKIKGHFAFKRSFGYKLMVDSNELTESIYNLLLTEVNNAIKKHGLSAYVYTQLSDVEDEVNGFVTYDRQVIKVDINKIKSANDELKKTFSKFVLSKINLDNKWGDYF